MRLVTLEYSEHLDEPQEWSISGLHLKEKNLVVGKNASGKSRTLNIINALSRIISGLQGVAVSGYFNAVFEHANKSYRYKVEYKDQSIIFEQLIIDDKTFLERGVGGNGKIIAEKIHPDNPIDFQTPTSGFGIFARRDAIQHSFLEPLYLWGASVRYYPFSTYLGKDLFAILIPNGPKADDRDHNAVIGLFREALKTFGNDFIDGLKADFAAIDYYITEINVASPISVSISGLPGEPVGLYVKERSLPGITDQHSMSVGMFRVLSLLIHVNYFQLMKSASTVLVDDIGEGLDFDRSCRLIDLLRRKADEYNIQIILSTNDKFAMNSVPLDEWSILVRNGNHVEVKNFINSREIFEEFRFTGLDNFSFFELDVINEQQVTD